MDKINIEKYEKLVKILEEYPSLHTEFEDSQCSHIKKFVNDLANYLTRNGIEIKEDIDK